MNNEKRLEAFQDFRQHYLNLTAKSYGSIEEAKKYCPDCDIFLAGSDQIWNPTFYRRCNPVYYLDFVPNDKKRIAYASSIGLSSLPHKYEADFKRLIQKMNAIAVREIDAANIIKDIAHIDVPVVLDPTLLLTPKQWDLLKPTINIQGEYILCYLFSDLEYIAEIKEWVKGKFKLKIVSMPYSTREMQSDDEKVFAASPADFVHLIRNSKLVLTDSFHATAFSINYQVPFFVLARQNVSNKTSMSSRIHSILQMFSLQDQMLTPENYKIKAQNICVDYSHSQKILQQKRNEAAKYLREAIDK